MVWSYNHRQATTPDGSFEHCYIGSVQTCHQASRQSKLAACLLCQVLPSRTLYPTYIYSNQKQYYSYHYLITCYSLFL